LAAPVDVAATVGSLREGARLRFAADGIWWTTRTPDGPATVQLVPDGRPAASVAARAWGSGSDLALAAVAGLVGTDDDPSDFAPNHPMVAQGWRRRPGLRLGHTASVMEALLPAIVYQRVPAADAGRSWRRLTWCHGQPAPGPASLRLGPDPARLARLSYPDLHRFGIERRRATTLISAARAAQRLEALATGPTERLLAGLQALPGVGRWTALSVARLVHGGPDLVVEGDYNLPSLVTWNLAGERTGDDTRMLELLEPERPHRARAMQVIATSGSRPPRHGPRLRPAAVVTF
jgi:3-methyladenine DNA glycosylase/8-oxoguanine DNA glycosylase